MPEDNWTRCQRLAREIDKDDLIRSLLVQIANMRTRAQKSFPLWSFVGEATSHGSGVSTAICYVYGVDSESGKVCKTCGGTGAVNAYQPTGRERGGNDLENWPERCPDCRGQEKQ